MTDTEILFWLVNNGAIDRAVLVYAKIAGNGETVATIRDRLFELEVVLEDES